MRNVTAILRKQWKDTLKNKNVLIQFVMFPALAVLMTFAVKMPGMPENYFVYMFASMYIGMAPLIAVTEVLSEEKEKHTLKALLMANVRMPQYLAAVGGSVLLACLVGTACFGLTASLSGAEFLKFSAAMMAGIILSVLTGAIIGIACKSQMSATSLTVPVMMVLSFLPMLSTFNHTIKKFATVFYSQQVYMIISGGGEGNAAVKAWGIIAVNLCVLAAAFLYVYRRYCTEE